jgi:FKBP-type peptidyl-prolyl cis-trans isomerase FkpA
MADNPNTVTRRMPFLGWTAVAVAAMLSALVVGVSSVSTAHAVDARRAQGPQKARKTPRPETATLLGVIEAPHGENVPSTGAIVHVAVRTGDRARRIAVNVEGTAESPPLVASHYGVPLAGSDLRVALGEAGRSVRVTYVVEPLAGTDSHLATAIEIGDAPKKGAPAPGLRYEDVVVGLGAVAQRGDGVTVHYTGWLKGGEQFESSRDGGEAMVFRLGSAKVIRGWELGIAGMREGGRRRLTIGPSLAYGAQGSGNRIPPNATLIFEVELLKVE